MTKIDNSDSPFKVDPSNGGDSPSPIVFGTGGDEPSVEVPDNPGETPISSNSLVKSANPKNGGEVPLREGDH